MTDPDDLKVVKWSSHGTSTWNPTKGLTHVDGWANTLTNLGIRNRDKRMGAYFARDFEIDRNTLENLYHGDDVVARICELPVQEALREWIEIIGDADRKISRKLDLLNARGKFEEALVWSRLYGASIIVMVVDDGKDLSEPLDPKAVKDIIDLMVIDRWDLWITRFYDDPRMPNFGQPMLYAIRTSAIIVPGQGLTDASYGAQIHESRVLRFEGTITGRRRRRDNQGWALSVMERVIDVCRDFSASYGGMANLLTDFSQGVFKIKGLAHALEADQDDLILKRLQLLDLARSIARAIPLDADGEDFDRKATPVAGLTDLLDQMASRLSFATEIPISKLMGTSAKGLNATGEGDETNWYNHIHHYQQTRIRHPLSRLIDLCAIVTGVSAPKKNDRRDAITISSGGMGAVGMPDIEANQPLQTRMQPTLGYEAPYANNFGVGIEFDFRPLWQPTAKETAETRKIVADTDNVYYQMGVLDSAEIGVSRFGGEKYSMETTIDIAAHDQNAADKNAPDDGTDAEQDNTDPELVKSSGNAGAGSDVQATALNGAQVTALQGMLAAVADKSLSPEAATIAIQLSFPAFDAKKIETMIKAIEIKEPEPVPAALANPNQNPNPNAPVPSNQAGKGAPSGDPVAVRAIAPAKDPKK